MDNEIKNEITSNVEDHEEELKEILSKYRNNWYEQGHIANYFYNMLEFAEHFTGTNGIRDSLNFYGGLFELRKIRIALSRSVYEDIVDFMKFLEEKFIINYTYLPESLSSVAHYCNEILYLDDPNGESDLEFYLAWLHSDLETYVEDFVKSRLEYVME